MAGRAVTAARRVVFLPGASGDADFWRPVAERLPPDWEKVRLDWPGAGVQPHDPWIRGYDDLLARAVDALGPTGDVVAQSMGGMIAMRLALRHPQRVRRLVLVATSGGFDAARDDGQDWRVEYAQAYPDAAGWISAGPGPDDTAAIGAITTPTLLLWGDRDPISPISAGVRLAALLPDTRLEVITRGTHSFAFDRADVVAPLIAAHLGA